MRRRVLAGLVVVAGMAALAPAASATINPTLTVTSTTPATAGSTGNLGLDIKFNPSSGSAPDQATLNLPPGVLANASIDNGQCIKVPITDFSNDAACQLGSGTVTAIADGVVPVPTNVDFYLVPPPAAGDLAGLAVATTAGDQIGSTNDIYLRPSGNPLGVGISLGLTLPNSLDGAPISVSEIDSTFTGTRFPATCPATPAQFTLTSNTYDSPSTEASASAPLPVTGCANLAYDPQFSVTATRDKSDKVVAITTTITQTATEATTGTTELAFPQALSPSIAALHVLCSNPASGTCTPVASVTAVSPSYPTPLVGKGYLTGSLSGLTLTLVFPPPFPITLTGTVNLKTNVTTFSGEPDIPQTSLAVSLNGGSTGLFDTNCDMPTLTSTATLTDANGDKTATPSSKFTIANCPASSTSGSGGSGSGSSRTKASKARLSSVRFGGLKTGRPSLRFVLTAAKKSNVRAFTVKLPKGLSYGAKGKLGGLSVKGGKVKSARVSRGALVVTLRKTTRKVTVSVSSKGLKESGALRKRARAKSKKKRLASLRLTVVAKSGTGAKATLRATTKSLGL